MPTNFLKTALEYEAQGLAVIPISAKKKPPRNFKWKPYQERRPTPSDLQCWFSQRGLSGIALILGPVSGDLYCRDFDLPEAYSRWANEFSSLAESLPTAQTNRGWHVYFRSNDLLNTRTYRDGELRGLGSYVIAPPSIHDSGSKYTWKIPLETYKLESLNFAEIGFCENLNQAAIEIPHQCSQSSSVLSDLSVLSVQQLIRDSLPTDIHQNHKRLFYLARGLVAIQNNTHGELSDSELLAIFSDWHEQSKDFLRPGQTFDEYRFEFLDCLGRVKYALGEEVINRAWKRAQALPSPPIAHQFKSPEIRLLVALCCELQRRAGTEPFFLSGYTVARLFAHNTHTTAAFWLRGLVNSKILKIAIAGDRIRATRYFYLGPCVPW